MEHVNIKIRLIQKQKFRPQFDAFQTKMTISYLLQYFVFLLQKIKMWKKNSQITPPTLKTNIKRLHLDKKQNSPVLPHLPLKDDKKTRQNQKTQKVSLNKQNSKKRFPLYSKHRTVIPFVAKNQNQSQKSFRSLDKKRSQSDWIQKQKPFRSRKQSLSRIKINNKNSIIQRQVKKQLHLLEEHKNQNSNISQNEIKQEQKQVNNVASVQDTPTQQKQDQNQYQSYYMLLERNGLKILEKSQQPKRYQSIAIQTDLQMSTETFKDFLKFKITQKQKYQKLQEIFQFVDDISHKDMESFTQRYSKVRQLAEEPLKTIREQQINHMIQNLKSNQNKVHSFMDSLIVEMKKVNKSQINANISEIQYIKQELHQLKKQINKFYEQKQFPNLSKNTEAVSIEVQRQQFRKKTVNFEKYPMKTNRNQDNKNCLSLEIHQKFSKINNHLIKLEMKIKNHQQETTSKLNQRLQEYKKIIENWNFMMQQKNNAIKVCVNDILRLPEMSLSIFGMKRDEDTKEDNEVLKKIGVFLDDIPEFDEFYSNQGKKRNEDFCFKEVLDFKCLNCAYLKSKMRFIYSKNQQLQSVVKILNHLIGSNKQGKQ